MVNGFRIKVLPQFECSANKGFQYFRLLFSKRLLLNSSTLIWLSLKVSLAWVYQLPSHPEIHSVEFASSSVWFLVLHFLGNTAKAFCIMRVVRNTELSCSVCFESKMFASLLLPLSFSCSVCWQSYLSVWILFWITLS